MIKISIAGLICIVSGCASITPHYDTKFGDAVRGASQAQTLNRQAPNNSDAVLGLDGRAAVNGLGRYQDSFKAPPRTFEVININGSLSGN